MGKVDKKLRKKGKDRWHIAEDNENNQKGTKRKNNQKRKTILAELAKTTQESKGKSFT